MHELRIALRRLRRSPTFVGASVATLSLAIGVNAAVFSVADAVLFRPLPYADPDQLYVLRVTDSRTGRLSPVVPPDLVEALLARPDLVAGVGTRGSIVEQVHTGPGGPEFIGTIALASDFLTTLGVRPAHGRLFDSHDAFQPGRAVILTYGCWTERFGGNSGVVGQSVTLAGETRDVVGVLPRDFVFPGEGLAYPFSPVGRPNYEFFTVSASSGGRSLPTIDPLVRLRSGVALEAAQSVIEGTVSTSTPSVRPRFLAVRPLLFPVGRATIWILLLASVFVLALGCANLSHLFVQRVLERQHESRVSLALGASRGRLIRTFALEALIIALWGAAGALLLAFASFGFLSHQVPKAISDGAVMGVDWRVALFTLAMALLSAALFTVLPTWVLATTGTHDTMFTRSRGASRRDAVSRLGIVTMQVAATTVLLSLAIAALSHLGTLLRQPLGFSPDQTLVVDAQPPRAPGPRDTFYLQAVERLNAQPNILSAGAVEAVPLSGSTPRDRIPMAGGDPIPLVRVLPGYFEAARIPLVRGRSLDRASGPLSTDALLSESAAAVLFPGVDPIGQSFQSQRAGPFTVVGVVGDVRMVPDRAGGPLVYARVDAGFTGRMRFVVRVQRASGHAPAEIRRLLAGLTGDQPVTARWWSDAIGSREEYRTPRFRGLVLGTSGLLALVLAILGILGVVSSDIRRRRHEIAIRIAVGAQPLRVTRAMMVTMTMPILTGLVIGVVGTWLVARVVTATVTEFSVWSWPIVGSASAVVIATALLAVYVPAHEASRLSPMSVLRNE